MIDGYRWIVWVIWGSLVVSGHATYRTVCQREAYLHQPIQNARLIGYVISTLDAPSCVDCASSCLSEAKCRSYNCQVSGHPLHKCELNSQSKSSVKFGSLNTAPGYDYHELTQDAQEYVPCQVDPCKNDGICEETCSGFPHLHCRCPAAGLAGLYCERMKDGNFVLNYTTGNNLADRVQVFARSYNAKGLTTCLWFKPEFNNGVVFSSTTSHNLNEIAMVYNESCVQVTLMGKNLTINAVAIPIRKWSHLCFTVTSKRDFAFFFNAIEVYKVKNISFLANYVKGGGSIVLGASQTSRGRPDYGTANQAAFTRFYMWASQASAPTILRLYNQPYVSYIQLKSYYIDWRNFYEHVMTFNETVVFPSEEPKLGNFDLEFPAGRSPVSAQLAVGPWDLTGLTLCMWLAPNLTTQSTVTVFVLKSGSSVVAKVEIISEMYLHYTMNVDTRSFNFVHVNTEWNHVCVAWLRSSGTTHCYINGNLVGTKYSVEKNVSLQVDNGVVELGGGNFAGKMAHVNMWSMRMISSSITALAFQPGSASGDVFSWDELGHNASSSLPNDMVTASSVRDEAHFDMIFPQSSTGHYIYMDSPRQSTSNGLTLSFWMKVPRNSACFTLLSFAIPGQVFQLNIHFGTHGLWMHLFGEKSLIPLDKGVVYGTWNHFAFRFKSSTGNWLWWRNLVTQANVLIDKNRKFDWSRGILVVGAQQTGYGLVRHTGYQFHGQLAQLQIWTQILSFDTIRMLAVRCTSYPGSVFRWREMPKHVQGSIATARPSSCLATNYGER